MLGYILLITMYFYDTSSYLASCTEDSQCPSKFYCEETAHYCRECLRCEDFKREDSLTPLSCVKSVLQCGPCLKSLIQTVVNANSNEKCITTGEEENTPHAYLPPYAWAAITVALVLMLITLCVFLKTKAFKVTSFSSRTSVRAANASSPCLPLAPPPYNYPPPPAFPQCRMNDAAPEIQRLVVESPEPCKRPPFIAGPSERPREGSANQAARVYNHPAYVRVPQSQNSSITTEDSMISPETRPVMSNLTEETRSPEASICPKMDMSFTPNDVSEENTNCDYLSRIARGKDQDSNNNSSSSEEPSHQGTTNREGPCRDAYIIGGPSFVINVVENINNLRQRNDT